MKQHHVLEGPAGAPVVTLSHSLGATLRLWDAQAAALTPRYRVLRYDARGHGASEVPPGPYTVEQMADDVRALLDRHDIAATHFVGLSMGGLVGMSLAAQDPRRVRSLVLADTTARYGPAVSPMWAERIRVAETEGLTEPLIERTMEIWFTPAFRERQRAEVDRIREMLRRTDPRGYAAAVRALDAADLTGDLAAIRCPTLVVVGAEDKGTPLAMAKAMHDGIAGSRLEVLPGAAHASCVEAAPAFNRLLLDFLAS